jgi:hypothetical protein
MNSDHHPEVLVEIYKLACKPTKTSNTTGFIRDCDNPYIIVFDLLSNITHTIDFPHFNPTKYLIQPETVIQLKEMARSLHKKGEDCLKIYLPISPFICIAPNRQVYFTVEFNHSIITIGAEAELEILVGHSTSGYKDGPGSEAMFCHPSGVCVSADNQSLFVADYGNHVIRKIDLNDPTRSVTTIAGSIRQSLHQPESASMLSSDEQMMHQLLSEPLTEPVTLRDGPALQSHFLNPISIRLDQHGNLYIADYGNHAIRVLWTNNLVTTLMDHHNQLYFTQHPSDIYLSPINNDLYIIDFRNNVLRKLNTINKEVTKFDFWQRQTPTHGPFRKETRFCLRNAQFFNVAFSSYGQCYLNDVRQSSMYKPTTVIPPWFYPLETLFEQVIHLSELQVEHQKEQSYWECYTSILFDECLTLYGRNYMLNRVVIRNRCPALHDPIVVDQLNLALANIHERCVSLDFPSPAMGECVRDVLDYIYTERLHVENSPAQSILFQIVMSILDFPIIAEYYESRVIPERLTRMSSFQSLIHEIHLLVEESGVPKKQAVNFEGMVDVLLLDGQQNTYDELKSLHFIFRNEFIHAVGVAYHHHSEISLIHPTVHKARCVHQLIETMVPDKICKSLEVMKPQTIVSAQTLDTLPDFRIIVDGYCVPCHAWVMASRWTYFKKMVTFAGYEVFQKTMNLTGYLNAPIVQWIVYYIYTGRMTALEKQHALMILRDSEMFEFVKDRRAVPGFENMIRYCQRYAAQEQTIQPQRAYEV